jgi:hypothetical protein
MVLAIILITVLYIAPLLGCYVWINKAHSKGGINEFTHPNGDDFALTIIPIVNIGALISFWEDSPTRTKRETKSEWISKFFGIKK